MLQLMRSLCYGGGGWWVVMGEGGGFGGDSFVSSGEREPVRAGGHGRHHSSRVRRLQNGGGGHHSAAVRVAAGGRALPHSAGGDSARPGVLAVGLPAPQRSGRILSAPIRSVLFAALLLLCKSNQLNQLINHDVLLCCCGVVWCGAGGADSAATASLVSVMCELLVAACHGTELTFNPPPTGSTTTTTAAAAATGSSKGGSKKAGDAGVLREVRRVVGEGKEWVPRDARDLCGRLMHTMYMGESTPSLRRPTQNLN